MGKPLDARIQFFADSINSRILDLESGILNGFTVEEEKKRMFQSEILEDLLEKFENVFEDILFKGG